VELVTKCLRLLNRKKIHYGDRGVSGYASYRSKRQDNKEDDESDPSKLIGKKVDIYDKPDECVVCMDAKRTVVNVPCGHMIACEDCGVMCKICPVCRAPIDDVLKVFYS